MKVQIFSREITHYALKLHVKLQDDSFKFHGARISAAILCSSSFHLNFEYNLSLKRWKTQIKNWKFKIAYILSEA